MDSLVVNCNFLFAGGDDSINIGGIYNVRYGYGRVDTYDGGYCMQTLIPVSPTISSTLVRYKSSYDLIWGEWEWVNPPMQSGVEYRTTERWLGKPVYVKTLDVGYVGIGMTTKHHNIQMTQCLSCLGFESGNDTMPAKYDDSSIDVYKNIYANNTQIIIYSNTDSNRYTHCTLKYTKD